MTTPKWKTTVMGILGALLTILNIWKPDWFSAENNAVIINSVGAIITAVLSVIAIFNAQDKSSTENIK